METHMELRPPVFLALDVDNRERALDLARQTHEWVGGYKVGPRLVLRYGAEFIHELAQLGAVFVDNKYFDIPSTMEAAIRATFEAGASYATIHAQCGREALERLATVEADLSKRRPFRILAVTILTSFDQEGLPITSKSMPIPEQVEALAEEVISSGLRGLVCSPHEVAKLRQQHTQAFLVTPGVRLQGVSSGDDQKRVMTPEEAMKSGASALVIGRPIYAAMDPAEAARRCCEKL